MRVHIRFSQIIHTALALAVVAVMPAFAQPLSDAVKQQISDVIAVKKSFTPAQQKVASQLMFAAKAARGELGTSSFASVVPPPAALAPTGLVQVDIKGQVTRQLLTLITTLGGRVDSQDPAYNSIRASIPLTSVDALAANPAVRTIGPADEMMVNVGALTSQGYVTHTANQVVKLGYDGTGVKVGVLSDSATPARVTALIASGDLPASTTVLEASSGTDEGAAMMEIVHDMAPGAQLYFATANGGQAHFASNITALAAAGCSIIVDDISYFGEGAFQDGPPAQAVNAFVASGGLYFSSAANSGNLTSGTSGTWEGDFLNGGPVSGPIATAGETGSFHNFGTAGTPVLFDTVTGSTTRESLKWSDPLGGSSNDYDIFLVNSTGTTLKDFSASVQNGTQDPFEIMGSTTAAVGDRIYVVLFSGSPRALRVDMHRGRLSINTAGSTFGHNGAQNTLSMAAVGWAIAKTGTKPFVGGAANPIEIFSSDGPRKIFYNPNGTAITPGNVLFGTNGGTTFQKPDYTAADGAFSKTPGFLPFYGTSAAAPHAAGIAALLQSAKPSATAAQIKAALSNSALDIMAPGVDRDSGAGIIMALPAINYLLSH